MPQVQNATPDIARLVETAIAANVPQLYINGFVNGLGTGDITIVTQRNGSPTAILNMSYTVAKTLAVALGQIVAHLEQQTGREMLTTHEVAEKLGVSPEGKKK